MLTNSTYHEIYSFYTPVEQPLMNTNNFSPKNLTLNYNNLLHLVWFNITPIILVSNINLKSSINKWVI